ncbi:MAG: hypothetical protein ACUZ77_10735 [Candidatus Brocadiales bacterium]
MFKKIEFLFPIFSCMPDWLKITTVIWLFVGVVIACITLPYYYKKNQSQYIRNLKKESIDIIRTFEDFDIWLDKTLDQCNKEFSKINTDSNEVGAYGGSRYLIAQFERVKRYQNKINEEWLQGQKRKMEDFLISVGERDISSIHWLDEDDKKKLIAIERKKEKAVKDIENETIDKLRMSSSEQDINNAYNGVFKK